jgi:hypothetical protein
MKKVIIGLSALMVLSFIVIFAVSAQNNDQEGKKTKAEVSKDCSKCPSASSCAAASGEAAVIASSADHGSMKCDPAKCKEGKCDPAQCKAGKCDPAVCKTNCANATTGAKCDPAMCSQHTAAKK